MQQQGPLAGSPPRQPDLSDDAAATEVLSQELLGWSGEALVDRVCASLVEEEAVWVEDTELVERTLARAAFWKQQRGEFPVTEELLRLAQRALRELLREDWLRLLREGPAGRDSSLRDRFVSEAMGFHPDLALGVAVRFNDLPRTTRRALVAILIRHDAPEEVLRREGGWDSVPSMLREILEVLLLLRDPKEDPS